MKNENWIIEGRGIIAKSAKSIKMCGMSSDMSTKSISSNTSTMSVESERPPANSSTASIRSMGSSISKEGDDIASSSAPVVWFGKSIYVVFATKFRRSSLRFKKKVHPDEVDKEWQYYW